MAREDWRDEPRDRDGRREARPRDDFGQVDYSTTYGYDPRNRRGYRAEDAQRRDDDYGQADYTTDWAYDPELGRPYRRFSEEDRSYQPHRDEPDRDRGRSWSDRAAGFFGMRHEDRGRDPDHDRYEADRRRDEDRRHGDERHEEERRLESDRRRRRRGPSDRVLWAVIMERLEDARGIDLRDVDVHVEDGEVTLNGTVRRREDKRRIEDIADVDGVRNIQNNLRPRDRDRGWTFL